MADHKGLAKTAFEDTDKLLTATLAQVMGFGILLGVEIQRVVGIRPTP